MNGRGRKPNFWRGGQVSHHNERNAGGGGRERKLDMKRERYFRMDLDDLLTEYKLGDNKGTVAATILNKMSRQSLDGAIEYVDRLKEANTLSDEAATRLKILMDRYCKWR
jgi:hypothetical protein